MPDGRFTMLQRCSGPYAFASCGSPLDAAVRAWRAALDARAAVIRMARGGTLALRLWPEGEPAALLAKCPPRSAMLTPWETSPMPRRSGRSCATPLPAADALLH